MKTLFLKVMTLLFLGTLSLWSAPLYSGNNFWAKLDIGHDANGIFYAMHRDDSSGYNFYTFDGTSWNPLTTLTHTHLGLYSIGENSDMAIADDGTLNLIFEGCINQYSCKAYYIKYDGTWSTKVDLDFGSKQYQLAIDSVGNYHVSFVHSSVGKDYLYYMFSANGTTWQNPSLVISSTTAGDDEIVKHWLHIGANNLAELYYVKEDSQNDYVGNLYMKSYVDAFSNVTTLVDATTQGIQHHYNDVYRDTLGRVHLNYTKTDATESWMYHEQLGSTPTGVGSSTLFERGQYRYTDETLYMLVLKSALDFSAKDLYLAKKRDGGSWSLGSALGISDISANEIVFDVADDGKVMILYQNSGIDNVNGLTTGNKAFLPAIYYLLLN
jgi:hypothetical protein